MKPLIHLLFFALTAMAATAQRVQSIFDWSPNAEIFTKDRFRPLFPKRFILSDTLLPDVLTFKTDVVKNKKENATPSGCIQLPIPTKRSAAMTASR